MNRQKAIVEIRIHARGITEDIEIPLNISANELLAALNNIYDLKLDLDNMSNCYIKTENPIALMKGSRSLEKYGVRNGTIINIAY